MSLLGLPPELRLRIYDHLQDFDHAHRKNVTISSGGVLTPTLSRTNCLLRRETLPLYARSAHFALPLEERSAHGQARHDSIHVWLDALGETGIAKVQSLLLSQHWQITQPTRWQTHVGFYLRLEHATPVSDDPAESAGWRCSTGTYPIANDMRGMRLESVELLQRHVMAYLGAVHQERQPRGLEPAPRARVISSLARSDLHFIMEAMRTVARHPISTYDLNQDQQGRQSRRGTFVKMEDELTELGRSYGLQSAQQGTFYTPY